MTAPRILAFAGSTRSGSFNRRLVAVAAAAAAAAGAEVTTAELGDCALPMYDGDLEAEHGLPDTVRRWKDLLVAHDGFLIASPEYNGAPTPLLKNAIDWATRPGEKGEAPLRAFRGKTAGLIAASPGGLGGLRGLTHLRTILAGIGVHVIPDQAAVSQAHQAFDDDGGLTDERTRARVEGVANALVTATRALRAGRSD